MRRGKVPKTVDEYLAGIPEPARSTLSRVRKVIRSVAPTEATEVISYRIPMFKYHGMLIGYAEKDAETQAPARRLSPGARAARLDRGPQHAHRLPLCSGGPGPGAARASGTPASSSTCCPRCGSRAPACCSSSS